MKLLTTVVGAVAAIATTTCWLPQVIKTWKTGSAGDFSWKYLLVFSAGITGWMAYGMLKKDWVIIAANASTLLLVFVIVYVKFREVRR